MAETADHTDTKEPTVWVTDAELIRRSGVPEKVARAALHALDADKKSGFPRKNPLWGGRRYWPAVKSYWERIGGVSYGR